MYLSFRLWVYNTVGCKTYFYFMMILFQIFHYFCLIFHLTLILPNYSSFLRQAKSFKVLSMLRVHDELSKCLATHWTNNIHVILSFSIAISPSAIEFHCRLFFRSLIHVTFFLSKKRWHTILIDKNIVTEQCLSKS